MESLTSQVRDRHFFHLGLSLNHFEKGAISAASITSSVHSSELQAAAGSTAWTKHPSTHFDLQKDFASSSELCAVVTFWSDGAAVPTLHHSYCTAGIGFGEKQINTENATGFVVRLSLCMLVTYLKVVRLEMLNSLD